MTTSRLSAVAAVAFAFVAASCGGDGGTGPTFADSVSTSEAQGRAAQTVNNIGLSVGQLNFGEGSIGLVAKAFTARVTAQRPFAVRSIGGHALRREVRIPDWHTIVQGSAGSQASAEEGCTVTQSGTTPGGPVDVDQNGFPDNLYFRQECLLTDSTSNADTTYISYLLVEERVKQNFSSLYGFDISVTELEKDSDEFGNFASFGVTGTEALDIRSGSATHRVNFTVNEGGKVDTASAAYEDGVNWNVAFAPSASIFLGDPLPNGALTLSGREYTTDTEDQNVSFTLLTDTPLAYSASCYAALSNPPFTAGVLIGRLNNNADNGSFSATFTACGAAPTISTEGTYAAPPLAAR
jgi:hypothetical protein